MSVYVWNYRFFLYSTGTTECLKLEAVQDAVLVRYENIIFKMCPCSTDFYSVIYYYFYEGTVVISDKKNKIKLV